MHVKPTRVIAVDWSGARRGADRRLWLAEVAEGRVQRLENGRSREQVTAELVRIARAARAAGERVVVGLDFAFGFPAWYMRERGWSRGHHAWAAFTEPVVDALLSSPTAPFWGRGAVRTRPVMSGDPLRATERAQSARPFSVFQLVGAGAVGTASLRGMATLHALSGAGASIWPFDDDPGGAGAVVAEVWPRLAAPLVVKSNAEARVAHLRTVSGSAAVHGVRDLESWEREVRASDDAFDALMAAVALWTARAALAQLPADVAPVERLEGRLLELTPLALPEGRMPAATLPEERMPAATLPDDRTQTRASPQRLRRSADGADRSPRRG